MPPVLEGTRRGDTFHHFSKAKYLLEEWAPCEGIDALDAVAAKRHAR
jgi:hypothetical protein